MDNSKIPKMINKKNKRNDNGDDVDESQYHMIRKVWESRNFMELNNWCQIAQCKLLIEQAELPSKQFKTKLTLMKEKGELTRKVTAEGFGHNKKESKLNAMRNVMENLMNYNLIHLGIKDKKYENEYYSLCKNEGGEEEPKSFSINKSRFDNKSIPVNNKINEQEIIPKEIKDKMNEKEISLKTKKMIKEIKEGKFLECCGCLESIMAMKQLEWYEFSHMWNYSLGRKNIREIRKLFDIIMETSQKDEVLNLNTDHVKHEERVENENSTAIEGSTSELNKSYEFMTNLISNFNSANNTNYAYDYKTILDFFSKNLTSLNTLSQSNSELLSESTNNSSIITNANLKPIEPLENTNTFSIAFLEELYNSLTYINDFGKLIILTLDFTLMVLKEINYLLDYTEKEFVSKEACRYYREKRFMLTLEILESVYMAAIRCVIDKNSQNVTSLYGRISKIGNRFSQDVISFIPSDLKFAGTKVIRRGNINTKENHQQISEKEFVLLSNEKISIVGYVREIENNNISKLVINSVTSELEKILYDPAQKFIMTKLNNFTAFEKTLEGLKLLTTKDCSSNILQKIIFSDEKSIKENKTDLNALASLPGENVSNTNICKIINQHLNQSQQDALLKASRQTLTLIQGPPGTGKTTLGIEIVIEWLRADSNSPILVCADSNVAVDILYRELCKAGVAALRLGVKDERLDDKESKFSRIKRQLRSTNVICSTCVGSLSEYLGETEFSRVLIDEATQATELSTIIPLVRKAQQVVLIGDHKQLPPTIISFSADKEGLSISLFERLINLGIKPIMLNTQYRMHPSISYFPSKCFYDNLLLNGIEDTHRPPILGFLWPNPNIRVCFINVAGTEEIEGNSLYNQLEIKTILDVLTKIFNFNTVNISDVGIITPYDSQKRRLKNEVCGIISRFPQLFFNKDNCNICSVDTVDGFQGMDKDLIIFSAVRSNDKGNMGFLKDPRRLNVMLTRAKRGLIVVGNYNCLNSDYNWRDWLEWIDYCGAIYK